MNNLTLTGSILSIYMCNNVANILVVDMDNPKHTVFKIALWGSEAEKVLNNQMTKGDEISVSGKIYEPATNQYGNYIDLRMCKLINMTRIRRTTITASNDVVAEDDASLPHEEE